MYENFYGFSGRPFQLTPDPAFFYESATHKKALSYLGYGLNQGEGFIVITGEVGAGKSTLVAHLMEKIDPAQLTVAQIVTSALDAGQVVHVVAQAFGLDVDGHDKASALGAIERFLQDEARAGRRCLLIVDECQNLEITALEELRLLSNFQLGSHPLLQSLLLGQPQFRKTVARHPDLDQLRQRVIASHHLEALSESEVEGYVLHRLYHVGWQGKPALREGLLSEVFHRTGGIPRRINQVMNRMLLLASIEEKQALTLMMLDSVCEEMASDTERGLREDDTAEPMESFGQFRYAAETEKLKRPEAKPFDLETAKPVAPESAETISIEKEPIKLDAADEDIGQIPADEVAALLAERDARTLELEAALTDLQAVGGSVESNGSNEDMLEAINRLERRLEEQEASFRHVLGMLIEWLEDDSSREAA